MTSHNDLQKLFERMMAGSEADDGAERAARPLDVQARVLLDMTASVKRPNPFKVGDLVVQRRGCEIYKWPRPGDLGLVTEVMPAEPTREVIARRDAQGFLERCDMVVMCYVDSEQTAGRATWLEIVVDSWRFDKWKGAPA